MLLCLSSGVGVTGSSICSARAIGQVCRKSVAAVVRYDDCVQVLNGDFQQETKKDLYTLTILSLNLAMANSPPALKPVIQACSIWFLGSYNSFHSTIIDVKAGSSLADFYLLYAHDGATNCRNFMKQSNISIPAVANRCNHVEFFAYVCYTVTEMLILKGN
ncbi:uncharacterized protein LOC116213243 isoform X2 [Punica granatum]|uniref:Uncharacterized protein LOC116213243 isoform X2 n=1 Tax=Punica granatum TaxID=22663 RepID=A0A6P8E242_PUNGR|nr:uncharacterized protein LOC116213243 isoform X2 [Punica granatum]